MAAAEAASGAVTRWRPVSHWVAEYGDPVSAFLADDARTVIGIDAGGWRACDRTPARFAVRRPSGGEGRNVLHSLS